MSWFRSCLEARFEVKTSMIGHGPNDASEGRVLNRIIRATSGGWEYVGDQRHAELIVQSLNVEKSTPVTTPGEDQKKEKEEESVLLDVARASGYRQIAARANYMAQDRADTQFAVKEVCRGMANPTVGHWRQLQRLGRYLRGRPRAVTKFHFQNRPCQVGGCSDSDPAHSAVNQRWSHHVWAPSIEIVERHSAEYHFVISRGGIGGSSEDLQ